MDPLSAISIAAAVVQFVDYGSRLLQDTVEIYRSSTGKSRDKLEISSISRDLAALSDEVESRLTVLGGSEEIFVRLCGTCRDIGKELQGCVDDVNIHVVSNPKRAVRSFLSALQERQSEERIKALRSRLDQVQQRMTIAVLVFLW